MKLESIYTTPQGYLRFFFNDDLKRILAKEPNLLVGEIVALDNMQEFWFSLSIICNRLHEYFIQPAKYSWSDNALYIDTQSYFMFCRQFMDDLTIIIRLSAGKTMRNQMSYSFSELLKGIRSDKTRLFYGNEPLLFFLKQELEFFENFIEIRDCIIHRGISTKQSHVYLFPDWDYHQIIELGGKPLFVSAEDLRTYLSDSIKRILALGCLCGDFTSARLRERYSDISLDTIPYTILPVKQIYDLSGISGVAMFLDVPLYESLAYFLELASADI